MKHMAVAIAALGCSIGGGIGSLVTGTADPAMVGVIAAVAVGGLGFLFLSPS